MSEVRDKLPPNAVINAEIQVCGYIDPHGEGGMSYAIWANCDTPLSTSLGLLELAKRDLIERCDLDATE